MGRLHAAGRQVPRWVGELSADEAVLKQVTVVATQPASSRKKAPASPPARQSQSSDARHFPVSRARILIFECADGDPAARKAVSSATIGRP